MTTKPNDESRELELVVRARELRGDRSPAELVERGRKLREPSTELAKLLGTHTERPSKRPEVRSVIVNMLGGKLEGLPLREPEPEPKPEAKPTPATKSTQVDEQEQARKAREKKRRELLDRRSDLMREGLDVTDKQLKSFAFTNGRRTDLFTTRSHALLMAELRGVEKQLAELDDE